ncbi:class I SAM-dependent methyltransferase [Flexivirga sp. ID2601S]|uniref:Class I SAM-dependent methyltransferase n=1 Tax=Flexivirga aerilata TaxID=1656889 RepID=A0A849ABS8_9MICO|nr:methyltransferase domain-containing protein [Flexivirga aerilata]NNG38354.1 class I SAM-dependent methyltransferase [Flexivirga aerilata]
MATNPGVPDQDEATLRLAREAVAAGDPTGWFEPLYDAASRGEAVVPWARGGPHPMLLDWAEDWELERGGSPDGAGRSAMVPGVGPGWDSELLASYGYATTGFDVSPTAVRAVREAHPKSAVDYRVADLFELPAEWIGAFDLVAEVMTVQSMPRGQVRARATAAVRSLVAPGGTLLVIGVNLPTGTPLDQGPPWCLTPAEIEAFAADDVALRRIVESEDHVRYRAEFVRAE